MRFMGYGRSHCVEGARTHRRKIHSGEPTSQKVQGLALDGTVEKRGLTGVAITESGLTDREDERGGGETG